MSTQIRDLRCVDCGEVVFGVACAYRRYPACANCGGKLKITWEGGIAPATDVYGRPVYSDATGECHTSQREKAKAMAEWGFHEAGDPVGGARREHKLRGTGFSFSGQSSRRTVSEGA